MDMAQRLSPTDLSSMVTLIAVRRKAMANTYGPIIVFMMENGLMIKLKDRVPILGKMDDVFRVRASLH